MSHGHYLLVVNAGNREAAYGWLKEREVRGTEVRDASDDYALVAVQGPASLDRLGLDDGKAFTHGMGEVGGIEVMVCRTGYTGEKGVELLCAAEDGAALWDVVLERGVVPCGLGARDTLRLEVCYPLHGNDITTETDAISAGLGWACALDTEFTGVDALRRVKGAGPERRLVAFIDGGEGDPPAGDGDRRRRGGDVGNALAVARRRHRNGVRPRRPGRGGQGARDRRARQATPCPCREEADLPEGDLASMAANESYPDDLRYHPEHDWARVEGDEAVLGITWYAQDALGELVLFEAPAGRCDGHEGPGVRRGRVGEGGLRRHRAAVGRGARGEPEGASTSPRRSTRTRTARDGSSAIRLSDPGEADGLMDVEAYRAHVAEQ